MAKTAFTYVDEFHPPQPAEVRRVLETVRTAIRDAVPGCGVTEQLLEAFQEELAAYRGGKGHRSLPDFEAGAL